MHLAVIILTVQLHEFTLKTDFHSQTSVLKLPKLYLGARCEWNTEVTGLYKFTVNGIFQIV